MWIQILRFLLPIAGHIVQLYIKNSDSKKDDLVLDLAKQTVHYMSVKDNNTMSYDTSKIVHKAFMK